MRKTYRNILKNFFHSNLIHTRTALELTQSEMAERLFMDDRSYINLDHGKNCCSAVTLALYLIYCCRDPMGFLEELKHAIESENEHAA